MSVLGHIGIKKEITNKSSKKGENWDRDSTNRGPFCHGWNGWTLEWAPK